MKLKTTNRNYWLITATVLLTWGLLIGLYWPNIVQARYKLTDKLLEQAKSFDSTQDKQGSQEQRLSYLQAANLVNGADPAAIESLAQYYRDRGEDNKVLDLYINSIAQPNFVFLGTYALKLAQPNRALDFFGTANREGKSATSAAGEAAALLSLGKPQQGCEKSKAATKLDLNNNFAASVEKACGLLTKDSQLTRAEAYSLLQALVLSEGEKVLEKQKPQTPSDYLTLARLKAVRGDLKSSLGLVEQGIEQDNSSLELYEAAVFYADILGQKDKAKQYQKRVETLKFESYQLSQF